MSYDEARARNIYPGKHKYKNAKYAIIVNACVWLSYHYHWNTVKPMLAEARWRNYYAQVEVYRLKPYWERIALFN